jgi:hypothetical protein
METNIKAKLEHNEKEIDKEVAFPTMHSLE